MALACQVCSTDARPVEAEHGNLCAACGNRVLRHLREVEHCYLALSAVPIVGEPGRHAPGFASSSPARDEVIAHTDPRSCVSDEQCGVYALAAVTSWVRQVIEQRGAQPPRDASMTALCDYLRARHSWIVARPWVDEYAAELAEIRGTLVRLDGLSPEPPVGHCLSVDCGGPVFYADDRRGARCARCDRPYVGYALQSVQLQEERMREAS
jgi:DNA-directed RNA polymerase subunit RPC12/RpoP